MTTNTRRMTAAALTAAAYAALTMLLAPLSYGTAQLRIAEALCVLPALLPCTAWGLFAGCAIANLISAAGPLDVVFGSLATLGAALCTAYIGRRGGRPMKLPRCAAACMMPAIWNGPIIGAVLSYMTMPRELFLKGTLLIGAQVALEELIVMLCLGLPLLMLLPRSKPFMELVDKLDGK